MDRPSRRQRRKLTQAARVVAESGSRQRGLLVVEGDPDLQWHLARMLTVRGHRVVGTSSGDGALALIEQWPVDLVLVDEELPGMPALEVVRRMRQDAPQIPVVMITGEHSAELQVAARLAGVVATLTKPFRAEALAELVESLQLDGLGNPAAE